MKIEGHEVAMGTTKIIKELLQDLRRVLGDESRAAAEPILRRILEAAKPEIRTKIEYRSDPRDKARIESLEAKLAAQHDELEKLLSKLAATRWAEQHWRETKSVDEVLQAVDKKAHAFMACIVKSMFLASDDAKTGRKKQILARSMALGNAVLGAYLNTLESCRGIDSKKLRSMIGEWSSEALERLARKIQAETGISVDLKLRLHGRPA